jgi:hypothetical protein
MAREVAAVVARLPDFLLRETDGARSEYIYPPPVKRSGGDGDARLAESVCAVEVHGRVVGLMGLCRDGRHSASIVRFQFNPAWQRTKAFRRLLRCVYDHCLDHHYQTLSIDAQVAPGWVRRCMDRHGFRLIGRRSVSGREQLQFGVDYHRADLAP